MWVRAFAASATPSVDAGFRNEDETRNETSGYPTPAQLRTPMPDEAENERCASAPKGGLLLVGLLL